MRLTIARLVRSVPLLALTWALTGALAGCATAPPLTDADATAEFRQNNDSIEPTNRFFYAVNDGLDTYLLRPVAVAYRYVPGVIRRPVHNMLSNLSSPITFANDVLQAKPRRAGDTMMRFLINSTAGIGGIFDVADDLGYKAHDTDFGVTLALWGAGEGPFLFLPIIGPSNPRDAGGFAGNILLDPLTYATFGGSNALRYSRLGVGAVDARERLLDPVDQVKRTALDPYATFRSLYRQNRQSEIDRTRSDDRATVPAWFR